MLHSILDLDLSSTFRPFVEGPFLRKGLGISLFFMNLGHHKKTKVESLVLRKEVCCSSICDAIAKITNFSRFQGKTTFRNYFILHMYLDYDVLRTTCMSVLNVEKRCNGFSIEDFNRVNEFSLNLFSSIFVQSMYSMLFRFSKKK